MTQPESFDAHFADAMPDLLAWCHLRMTAQLRRRMEPEEVLNEVWMRASGRYADFDAARGSFRGWLIGFARNVCLEGLRRSIEAVASDSVLDANAGRPRSTLSVRSRLANEEAFHKLLSELSELEEDERELIARLTFEDAQCADIARSWGKTEEAVTKQWQRLRARLRESPMARSFLALD